MNPTITALRVNDSKLLATIDGTDEVPLAGFRPSFQKQGVVPIPYPHADRCKDFAILYDPDDRQGGTLKISGAIRDFPVAEIMRKFAQGELEEGFTYEKKDD